MSRLPFLSARRPQIGAIIALMAKVDEKTTPDQILTEDASTPSSRVKYMGRKGISIV